MIVDCASEACRCLAALKAPAALDEENLNSGSLP